MISPFGQTLLKGSLISRCCAKSLNAGAKKMNILPSKSFYFSLTLLVVLLNIAFFYTFAISLKDVFIALIYFVTVVCLPGYCIAALFFQIFRSHANEQPSWRLMLPLSTIFGIGNVLLSYVIGQVFNNQAYNYLFAWAYLIILIRPVRMSMISSMVSRPQTDDAQAGRTVFIILIFTLSVNILFFLLRPTPGIVPIDILHDHVWNAGNTVSLTSHFPLQSMNIEQRPYLAYHILIYIMGAHMALTTGLVPHLVGLQFIFVPLIPLLVMTMATFLEQFLERKDIYLFYGVAVLLFGGGFAIIHEVKVRSYLGSNTNFIGIILLFSMLTVMMHLQKLNTAGRFISFFAGLFLATAAKGSIGATLTAGAVLWTFFRVWKKQLTRTDMVDCLGALSGFAASFLVFFVLPVWGQPVFSDGMGKASFPLIPLSYITKNDLASPFIEFIYKYMPGHYQVPAHIFVTVILLPVFIVLYFSYRLIAVYDLKKTGLEEMHQRILFIALGSLLVALAVNTAPMDNAYFMTSGLFIMDIFFIRHVQKERLFSLIRSSYGQRQVYAFLGALLIVALPFVSMGGWIKPEQVNNFFMDGKIGQLMNDKFSKTTYRRNHQSITPQMYEALSYIRKNTEESSIVVSPLVDLPDGRHLAFYTSTFSERTAFIEGYEFAGLAKEGLVRYVGSSEIKTKREIIKEIYTDHRVPEEMQNNKYVYLIDAKAGTELAKNYSTKTLFGNSTWSVLHVASKP